MKSEKNDSFEKILDKIKSSTKILLSLHDGPDGDSFGSCTAMKYWLENSLKKEVELISPDRMGEDFELFDFFDEVKFGKGIDDCDLDEFDLVLFLDSGKPGYYSSEGIRVDSDKIINIDHHETNSYYGEINYVDPKRSSTCSILIDLFRAWGVKFDRELSTRLLLGVYTDSLGFSINSDSIIDASFLINNKADYGLIMDSLRFNISLKMKKYFALLYDKFNVVEVSGKKIGFSCVTKKEIENLGLNLSEVRMGINELQTTGGIDVFFTLVEVEDMIKGSFRSRKFDVSKFARDLGGGGHKGAAAFRMNLKPMQYAKEEVLNSIKKVGVHPPN